MAQAQFELKTCQNLPKLAKSMLRSVAAAKGRKEKKKEVKIEVFDAHHCLHCNLRTVSTETDVWLPKMKKSGTYVASFLGL